MTFLRSHLFLLIISYTWSVGAWPDRGWANEVLLGEKPLLVVEPVAVVLSKDCEACQDLLESLKQCPSKAERVVWYSVDSKKHMQTWIMRFPYLKNLKMLSADQKKSWKLKGTPTLVHGEAGAELFRLGGFGCADL